ncbi:Homeotic protein female sterile [Araneus ventricosus]|uniref:Homeotic protein female sterile n=1 Tax=Araneus ventricosus TaxID=182803 RepID=A0A4Y2P1K1_ARAVE|nr:Homeotic protein female sterile [Araneus ventricosus]
MLLHLPDYSQVIKHPMDLQTIKRKLDNHEYKSPDEFASDVRLIFTTCYKYNPPDHEVVVMARKLQGVFEIKYAEMPDEPPASDVTMNHEKTEDSAQSISSDLLSDSLSDSGSADSKEEEEKRLKVLQEKFKKATEQISVLTPETKKKDKNKKKQKRRGKSKEIKDHDLPLFEPPTMAVSPAAQPTPTKATKKTSTGKVPKANSETPNQNKKTYDKRRKKAPKYQKGNFVTIQRTQFGTGLKLRPQFLGLGPKLTLGIGMKLRR